MNRIQKVFNNQHGIEENDFTYDFALHRLCVAKEDSWRGILPSTYSSDFNPEPPLFAAKFANCEGFKHILAIANEDGKIALQDTTERNYEAEERSLSAEQCHYNAVFDLEWAPGQMNFVSASGDHTARLWEVTGSDIRGMRQFLGHTRSVKTVSFRRNDPYVFATGGRDGAIIIWDTRANLNVDLTPRADNCIYSGHVGGPGTPVSQRKRSRTPKMPPNTTSSSITGLAFQDTNTLISCGAGDGVIKVWDLRRNYTAYKKEPHPKHSLPYAGTSTFKGFTNLLVDTAGSRLYANCMDNTIYCYNLHSYAAKPLSQYKGLFNGTFYIKSCLSPDGKYLLSGSSDEKAYIWNLNHPDEPLVALSGHTVEVTCVAWGSTHDRPIVTCSDDARHKIWRIGPEEISDIERTESYRGHASYVRQFGRRPVGSTHKYNLRDLESTPRSLRRLVEQNERTPSSMEKVPAKRSFLEMLNNVAGNECAEEQPEAKRHKTMESRGRRLFSPSTSNSSAAYYSTNCTTQSVRCLNIQLSSIPEERTATTTIFTSPLSRNQMSIDSNQENALESPLPCVSAKLLSATTTPSPLSERSLVENNHPVFTSPPTLVHSSASSSAHHLHNQQQISSTSIFSPTSNLPNYVLDGEAPHLSLMSPKRKLKGKVDWLTKIRKQKLMSSYRGSTLTDKMAPEQGDECFGAATTTTSTEPNGLISSPRLQSLRNGEGSPRIVKTPRRRFSRSGSHDPMSPCSSSTSRQHPKTPTSSRRNSETTILRFFSVQATPSSSLITAQRDNEDCITDASSTSNAHVASTAMEEIPSNLLPMLFPTAPSPASSNIINAVVPTTTATTTCAD